MRIWAIANQKGGVGKTTTTLALGRGLAALGQRVLLIDLDPHASLTRAFGVPLDPPPPGVLELFATPPGEIAALARGSAIPGLDYLCAQAALATLERRSANQPGLGLALQHALAQHGQRHDYILLDCAPTLGLLMMSYLTRMTRSTMLDVLNSDYIRTAHAKGLKKAKVIFKHALKNALIPVVTYIGIDFGTMLAGAILTETVFNWPGIGYETYRAITSRDWPIVLGSVTVIVLVVMVINLIVDVSYAFLDPRIRFGAPKDKN